MISDIPARSAVLGVARAMQWVREAGPNRGEAVEAILRSVHLPAGAPWCAAFVSWCGQAALGSLWPLPMVGGCATLGEKAEELGLLKKEKSPGAVFLLYSPEKHRFHHTGFLVRPVADHEWLTVEGNTNEGGSIEGIGVFERRRIFAESARYIWWWL